MISGLLLLALRAAPFPIPHSPFPLQDTTKGKAVYVKWWAGCHGDGGAGDGPSAAHMLPRPRNFTGAIYKIRSTASGQLPTDADLMRAIDEGLPGSAMPAWKGRLSDGERRDVAAYIKTFSSFFTDTSQHVAALKFSSAPGGGTDPSALKEGRRFYEDSIHCNKCHGDEGRGDGPSAPTLKDDAGFPIYAADLHQSWRFRGGPTAADIYRRLRTGLDGTPMPSFSDLIDQKFLTDEQLWRLAQYVRSLSPAETLASDDSSPPPSAAEPWPDQLAVQFPRHIPDGMERPYFLMGAVTDPVYQWRWTSQPRRTVAGLARGIDQFDALPSAPAAQAVYDHGEWRVVVTRGLATPATANEGQGATGGGIPVAAFALGESGGG